MANACPAPVGYWIDQGHQEFCVRSKTTGKTWDMYLTDWAQGGGDPSAQYIKTSFDSIGITQTYTNGELPGKLDISSLPAEYDSEAKLRVDSLLCFSLFVPCPLHPLNRLQHHLRLGELGTPLQIQARLIQKSPRGF